MNENKKPGLVAPIVYLVVALIFAGVGVWAYLNDYYILLFRVIPLNGIAFGIIAVILLALAIWGVVKVVNQRKSM